MSHISNEKWKLLNERMQMLGIKEAELQESFIQGGGSGGQKINNLNERDLVLKLRTKPIYLLSLISIQNFTQIL